MHKSRLTLQAYEDLDIEVCFGPVYTPELNPIEMTFSLLKNSVKRMRLHDMMNKKKRDFRELIPIAANKVSVSDVNN